MRGRDYIPDLTERFPEGFGGVDLTDSFFPSERVPFGHELDYQWDYDAAFEGEPEEAEEVTEPKLFKVGQNYSSTSWFTGGTAVYTVKKRTYKSVTFGVERDELDGHHKCKAETYDIKHDEKGSEYITLCCYQGEENNIYAGFDEWGNPINWED